MHVVGHRQVHERPAVKAGPADTRGRRSSATPAAPRQACACGGDCPRCHDAANGSRVRLAADQHPDLPARTPAWTEDGVTRLGWPWLIADRQQRARILRHEAAHRLHQRIAPHGESAADRRHAEAIATRAENAAASLTARDLRLPVPRLLAAPAAKFSPWERVWIGGPGIVPEIVANGVVVRIFLSYASLGLPERQPHTIFTCTSHDQPEFPALADKMRGVAAKVAAMNAHIADTAAARRVALVCVYSEPDNVHQSRYRTAHGQGALMLSRADFEAGLVDDTIAHEVAHGLFEAHAAGSEPGTRTPSGLALRMADLFARLKATKPVPLPTEQFNPASPPPLTFPEGTVVDPDTPIRAGVVMVLDTLWGEPGGHPWDNVDEFFASALAGSIRQPKRFRLVIEHYAKTGDPLPALSTELFELLAAARDPARASGVAPPADPTAAQSELAVVKAPVDMSNETAAELGWLVEPSSLLPSPPARELNCKPTEDAPKSQTP